MRTVKDYLPEENGNTSEDEDCIEYDTSSDEEIVENSWEDQENESPTMVSSGELEREALFLVGRTSRFGRAIRLNNRLIH